MSKYFCGIVPEDTGDFSVNADYIPSSCQNPHRYRFAEKIINHTQDQLGVIFSVGEARSIVVCGVSDEPLLVYPIILLDDKNHIHKDILECLKSVKNACIMINMDSYSLIWKKENMLGHPRQYPERLPIDDFFGGIEERIRSFE